MLLTGDNEATARSVAAAVGIDDVISGALPEEKASLVGGLGGAVAMVGDCVNDGPALARAQLGLALGSGTDVAICAADMLLPRDDLSAVPDAIALARATYRTIRRNLAWAFCYNLLALPLAALGFLNPLIAAAAMTLSSIFVVWNSLHLHAFRPPTQPGDRHPPQSGPAGTWPDKRLLKSMAAVRSDDLSGPSPEYRPAEPH